MLRHAAMTGLLLLLPLQALAGDWAQIYEQDGVAVSRKEVEGSKLFAFKGDTIMDAEIGRVVYVLLDNDHRTEWVDRLHNNYLLETYSPYDYVLYQHFELPALFSDRDYVYRGRLTQNPQTEVVTLSLQSVEHAKAPETVGVRAELINSQYVLTPTADGKTRVEVEIITDPKGWMPAWLVNVIQKEWPVKTLNGLRGQLDKPFTQVAKLPNDILREEEAARVAAAEAKAAEEAAGTEGTETPEEAPAPSVAD